MKHNSVPSYPMPPSIACDTLNPISFIGQETTSKKRCGVYENLTEFVIETTIGLGAKKQCTRGSVAFVPIVAVRYMKVDLWVIVVLHLPVRGWHALPASYVSFVTDMTSNQYFGISLLCMRVDTLHQKRHKTHIVSSSQRYEIVWGNIDGKNETRSTSSDAGRSRKQQTHGSWLALPAAIPPQVSNRLTKRSRQAIEWIGADFTCCIHYSRTDQLPVVEIV